MPIHDARDAQTVAAEQEEKQDAWHRLSVVPQPAHNVYATSTLTSGTFLTTTGTASPVPEPAAFTLLGLGLSAFGLNRRRSKH